MQQNAVILTRKTATYPERQKPRTLPGGRAENSLENKQEALTTIPSPPPRRHVIEKNISRDKQDSGSGGAALCTIYDLSYLTMELNIAELDISSVESVRRSA